MKNKLVYRSTLRQRSTNFLLALMIFRLLIPKFDIRQQDSELSGVEVKLRWHYFGKPSKIDSALIRLSI